MGGDVAESAGLVEFFQSGFYRSNVAEDTVGSQHGKYLPESIQGVLDGSGIDDQFRTDSEISSRLVKR